MTTEEAIKRLINQECRRFCNDIPSNCEVIDCETKVAIEALEKQIPKQIINYDDCEEFYIECPVCHHRQDSRYKHNYCDKCGQKLEYSNEVDKC